MSSSTTFASVENVSPEYTESEFLLPVWNLGAEWTATEWLMARMGYVASTGSETDEIPASASTVNERIRTVYSEGMFTLGVGLRFGTFGLDATVNSDVLRQGLRQYRRRCYIRLFVSKLRLLVINKLNDSLSCPVIPDSFFYYFS